MRGDGWKESPKKLSQLFGHGGKEKGGGQIDA